MLRIGLTGGIGSGKTTVAKIFELLNVPVYYADDASKRLYDTDNALMANMKKHFGEDIYSNEHLNRSKLAAIVFNNPEKLSLLNNLAHPPTIKDAEQWMTMQTAPYIIKEAALLFESGSVKSLDYVIGVSAHLPVRLKRAMDRDNISAEQVMNRMKGQMEEEKKIQLSDFIINNNEQELVIPQVLKLHEKFLSQ